MHERFTKCSFNFALCFNCLKVAVPQPTVVPPYPVNHFGPPSHSPYSLKYKQNIGRKWNSEVMFDVLVTQPCFVNLIAIICLPSNDLISSSKCYKHCVFKYLRF